MVAKSLFCLTSSSLLPIIYLCFFSFCFVVYMYNIHSYFCAFTTCIYSFIHKNISQFFFFWPTGLYSIETTAKNVLFVSNLNSIPNESFLYLCRKVCRYNSFIETKLMEILHLIYLWRYWLI